MQGGFPFLLKACRGFIESVGHFTFGGQLTRAFTAHPKLDPDTGALHFFGYACAPIRLMQYVTSTCLAAVRNCGWPWSCRWQCKHQPQT